MDKGVRSTATAVRLRWELTTRPPVTVPADAAPPILEHTWASLPATLHAPVHLTPAPRPRLIALNEPLAALLGLDPTWLRTDEGVAMLTGSRVPEGALPVAMAYAGHQFGGWSGRLGDGRALLLGERVATDGERRDIHLKGSGRTPFSRGGDGKAGLGPVLREYVVSEAMHALGIPTSRALAATLTGEQVFRRTVEPGAVFARVARSHVRVGTFQYLLAADDRDALAALTDYVIARHFPELEGTPHRVVSLLEAVVARHARLVAQWMAVGFIHGVMNTDNTQIVGETIDYGPCAFLDTFHPGKVFSSIDHGGRYAYANQPRMAVWNLTRLAEALLPLLPGDDAVPRLEAALGGFGERFVGHLQALFADKLGLGGHPDPDLLEDTMATLTAQRVDFTLFFRHLTRVARGEGTDALRDLFDDPPAADAWLQRWRAAFDAASTDRDTRVAAMAGANPVRIPRNHRIEQVIAAGVDGDLAPFHHLVRGLAHPFEDDSTFAELEEAPAPDEVVCETFCGT